MALWLLAALGFVFVATAAGAQTPTPPDAIETLVARLEQSLSTGDRGAMRQLAVKDTDASTLDDFAAADEGPNGSVKFKPIQTSLKHSYGIKKRWYLTGGGEDWSRNVLIVMDEKNQLWGFMMGYSE